ncbi:MAG: amino acid permease [Proteobacteria bacterium]|nr:amino acid permease [Pseudomonadota bacterium]
MSEVRFSRSTAISVVVANMIGTGVFTSLGFQLLDIQSGFVLMMLWAVGGVTAICGALCYAELGAALPRSGGEYNFLSQIYHPGMGFVAGWVSATIGFAAPTALAAITFGAYLNSVLPSVAIVPSACALVLALTAMHAYSRGSSGRVQRIFTTLKIVLIVGFCTAAFVLVDAPQPIVFVPSDGDGTLLFSGAFAVALIYVNYAYTGWNAATYLTGELDNPQRNLPVTLFVGTVLVALLYLWLNYTFLMAAPLADMQGKVEIGYIAAQHIFPQQGARVMGIVLALLLVSTVSAMILAGPRVLQMIGQDFAAFGILSKINRHGVPYVAICVQSLMSIVFIATASFDSILVFAGFTLGLSTLFTVVGVFWLRVRRPDLPRPFRVIGYPLPPLVFTLVMSWTLVYILIDRPMEGLAGVAICAVGAVFYTITASLRPSEKA